MKMTVTVCDSCQSPTKPTASYSIRCGNRSVSKDLCAEHGAPLEALLGGSKTPKKTTVRKAPAKKSIARQSRVVSMEEIEAAKAARFSS